MDELEEAIRFMYKYLLENQTSLSEDMAKVLQDNLWDLYVE